jgi:hypothetical protein
MGVHQVLVVQIFKPYVVVEERKELPTALQATQEKMELLEVEVIWVLLQVLLQPVQEILLQNLCLKEILVVMELRRIMLVLVVEAVPVRQLLIFQIKGWELQVQAEMVVQVLTHGQEIQH